jgi:hypothetical protein
MLGGHVLDPRIFEVEVGIAFLAEMMIPTLRVVLLSRLSAFEVEIAVIAGPVGIGIFFMLF